MKIFKWFLFLALLIPSTTQSSWCCWKRKKQPKITSYAQEKDVLNLIKTNTSNAQEKTVLDLTQTPKPLQKLIFSYAFDIKEIEKAIETGDIELVKNIFEIYKDQNSSFDNKIVESLIYTDKIKKIRASTKIDLKPILIGLIGIPVSLALGYLAIKIVGFTLEKPTSPQMKFAQIASRFSCVYFFVPGLIVFFPASIGLTIFEAMNIMRNKNKSSQLWNTKLDRNILQIEKLLKELEQVRKNENI